MKCACCHWSSRNSLLLRRLRVHGVHRNRVTVPYLVRRALFFNTGRVQSSRLPDKMGLQCDDVSQPGCICD